MIFFIINNILCYVVFSLLVTLFLKRCTEDTVDLFKLGEPSPRCTGPGGFEKVTVARTVTVAQSMAMWRSITGKCKPWR